MITPLLRYTGLAAAAARGRCASSVVFGIVLLGSLFALSIAEYPEATGTVIGLDLGTTYSRVGVFKNGHVEIIANDQGGIIPSWVGFTDSERLIGEAAKIQAAVNPERAVFDFKRIMGRKFEDKEVQRNMKLVPYKIINKEEKPYIAVKTEYGVTKVFSIEETNNKIEKPYIEVKTEDGESETKVFSPEEVSAMVLTKLKETAEAYLGKKIKNVVVTVPAYFNYKQQQAIRDTAAIAGLNVVRLLYEPTAAAIAYDLLKTVGEKNILVFDLGGGTFDVSILNHDDWVFDVLATNGDTHLGGKDFDQRIVEYLIKLIKKKHGKDVSMDNRALDKLRTECELAKRALSTQHQVQVEIESLVDGVDVSEPLTRAQFEELNADLFRKTLGPVKKAMEDAGLGKCQIDEILLVGGSTRIPMIQQLVKDYFDGKEPKTGMNPEEAVTFGAVVLGETLRQSAAGPPKDKWSVDYLNQDLGIETVGGVMAKLISEKKAIPTTKSQVFTTYHDNQTTVTFQVFAATGGRNLTKDCSLLRTFDLTGIAPAPRGTPQIEVTFLVDARRNLIVKAEDKGSGKIVIIDDIFCCSQESDRIRMVGEAEEAKKLKERNVTVAATAATDNSLQVYVYNICRIKSSPVANRRMMRTMLTMTLFKYLADFINFIKALKNSW